ncbi:PilN domain-containing protein [Cellulomonas sp. SG140]|uniref:PilN domain-containing protein n=1 Tax=Cellulomonas sp. SG140 TaxID=2976536 RepID=UPI0021E78631|nr:fimbrial assembly protein [Cellulomonas sp. SG140]
MTAIADPPRAKKGVQTVLGGLPQVNLLPPEVRAARGLRNLKRWLAMALVLVLVLCIAVFALAKLAKVGADDELAKAQADTRRLQTEQQKYAEVPVVLGALQNATTARALGMATDVSWASYYAAITAVLPPDVSIDSFVVTSLGTGAAAGGGAAANPLQPASVGQIQFTGRSTTVPNTAAWLDALNAVPGFADAWASSANITQSQNKTTYYNVSVSVQLTSAAYTHRFDATKKVG